MRELALLRDGPTCTRHMSKHGWTGVDMLGHTVTSNVNLANMKPATELRPQAVHSQQPHNSSWRILVVLAGMGAATMSDGPRQRVRELCLQRVAQGSGFCEVDEDTRVYVALAVAACFFLIDVIVQVPAAMVSWIHRLFGGICVICTELKRCWRRRRKRQAREIEKKAQQQSREAALEVDRRIKQLAALEMTITRDAVRKHQSTVRQRKTVKAQTPRKLQLSPGETTTQQTSQQDIQQVEPSCLVRVAADDCRCCQTDDSLSVDGSDAGSEQSKFSTDSSNSDKWRSSDEGQLHANVVVEGVSHKLVAMLLLIIGIIGIAMVLETLQLAKQNREWSGTVDRAVGTDLIIHIAKVMHETQKERGMTAIHVGSGGTELLFELGQQHVASDTAITGMVDALSKHIAQHATHLRTIDKVSSTNSDDGGRDAHGGMDSGSLGPPSLTREKGSRFDHAVRTMLAFVAELPKRRHRHIPRSAFAHKDSLLDAVSLPAADPTAAASAADPGCGDQSNCSLTPADELESAIGFYTTMHLSFIALATEMCTDFMTGVAPGVSNQLAPALFAFINLMVLKEKAGIERAVVSGQIALHDYVAATDATFGAGTNEAQGQVQPRRQPSGEADLSFNQQARIPLATMVRLREVVAQQEGYRTAFFRFAPEWAAEAYRLHRKEGCVVESLRMRALLLRPLRKTLGVSIVEEDTQWSQVAHGVTKDDYEEPVHPEAGFFTAVDWFSNQTCRLDSLDALSRKLSWAIEADARSSRHDAEHRLVWLVTPLGLSFVLTLVVAYHTMRTFCAFQDAAQARVASLTERQTMYKTLAERWAPLSLAAHSSFDAGILPSGVK